MDWLVWIQRVAWLYETITSANASRDASTLLSAVLPTLTGGNPTHPKAVMYKAGAEHILSWSRPQH
jgi:hypothetical protein